MSKRDLKKYLSELDEAQLREQVLELYDKFPSVKTYYDFVFNPKEDKLIDSAKQKITAEYFPLKGKRAKMRRSVAQKYIKHFLSLGVEAHLIADLMLFTIETAQRYSEKRQIYYSSAFYKSFLNAFDQVVGYAISEGIVEGFKPRILNIADQAIKQNWENAYAFEFVIEKIT